MSQNSIDNQIKALTEAIEAGGAAADVYFRRGMLNWKAGRRAAAITDYETAVSLDADSPAAEALRMSRDIMDFRHNDLLNP